MAHEVDTAMFGGATPAWHQLGKVIDEDVVTAEEAIGHAGLDWEVEMFPIQAIPQVGEDEVPIPVPVPNFYASVRTDRMKALGVLGSGYKPVQNREAFTFMDDLVDSAEAKYHTAGSLREGRQVWMLARIPGDILIGGEESERIHKFLLLRNSHDGSSGLGIFETPIRVVCANTLSAAIGGAIRHWSTRHTQGIKGRMNEARRTMELSFRYYDIFEELGNHLLETPLPKKRLDSFLEDLIPYPEDLARKVAADPESGGRSAKNIEEARDAIRAIALHEPNLDNVRGTGWAAWNAVAQWDDHQRPVHKSKTTTVEERRFLRTIEEVGLKTKAVRLLAPEFASRQGENLSVMAEVS